MYLYKVEFKNIISLHYLQKRFEGTRVTVESFLAWRKQFEMEMGIPAKREKEGKDKNKLTGKELFLRDTTLNESDLKFLEDGKNPKYFKNIMLYFCLHC